MTKRISIPQETITDILYASARRCNYCYGLNQDLGIKDGQFAHLDRDPSNNDFNNLCYMCLAHHDAYDTKRRQTKNYIQAEAIKYRDELYALISRKREEAEKQLTLYPETLSPGTSPQEQLSEFGIQILQVINDPISQLLGGVSYATLLVKFSDKTKLDLHLNKLLQLGYIVNRNGIISLLQKAKMLLYGHTL